jgi:putative transposase
LLTGKPSRKLLVENTDLTKQFWGQHLWGRGYCAASSGNVTDEVIMQSSEHQAVEAHKDGDVQIAP